MLNTVTKPPQQLLQNSTLTSQQALHQQAPLSRFNYHQTLQQQAYLAQLQFCWSPAGSLWQLGRQAQPKPQLSSYRQFIRVVLSKGHFILAECVQLNTHSLSAQSTPINLDFWITVRSGVIQ